MSSIVSCSTIVTRAFTRSASADAARETLRPLRETLSPSSTASSAPPGLGPQKEAGWVGALLRVSSQNEAGVPRRSAQPAAQVVALAWWLATTGRGAGWCALRGGRVGAGRRTVRPPVQAPACAPPQEMGRRRHHPQPTPHGRGSRLLRRQACVPRRGGRWAGLGEAPAAA